MTREQTNAYMTQLSSTLSQYRRTGYLCDVILLTRDNQELKAHSVMLAATSPVFKAAFSGASQLRFIHVPQFSAKTVEIALDFVYAGELLLPSSCSNVQEFAALMLELEGFGLPARLLTNCKISFDRKDKDSAVSKFVAGQKASSRKKKGFSALKKGVLKKIPKKEDRPTSRRADENIVQNHVTCNDSNSGASTIDTSLDDMKTDVLISGNDEKPDVCGFNDARFTVEENGGVAENLTFSNSAFEFCNRSATDKIKWEIVTPSNADAVKRKRKREGRLAHKHQNVIPSDEFMCELCGQILKHLRSFRRHIYYHKNATRLAPGFTSANTNFVCEECGKVCISRKAVKQHRNVHSNLPGLFKCPTCERCFKYAQNMRRHSETHSNPHVCDVCGKSYTQKQHMEKHRAKHDDNSAESYICDVCGKHCPSKSSLQQHGTTHLRRHVVGFKAKPRRKREIIWQSRQCPKCGQSFAIRREFEVHLREHDGKEVYQCADCPKAYPCNSNLILHRRVHTRECPYVCSECGKCFRQESGLTIHKRTHSGEKPYHCEVCGGRYAQLHHLKAHMNIHTGFKPQKCRVCGKGYRGKNDLLNHVAREHGLDLDLVPAPRSKQRTRIKLANNQNESDVDFV